MMAREHLSRDLHSILESYLDLVGCDGGSIYTMESNLLGEPVLVFKAMITRSLGIFAVPDALKSAVFRLDENSLVGKTGFHRKVFKELSKTVQNGTDLAINYQTRNILSAPLLTPRGDLVGVVQLVNKLAVNQ
jgi:DNA helicase HerA-like ATPase